ncbi:MAG: hypothetical protein KZQ64_07280 [gamma proteobacterium symbiont of Bathyaustriella thionipta]|nr:hypothetical protein [gamma proteobacterium symbiont of Bathyaustriella thionipta]MCU7951354.1 hypothetical protein [gamma proteobacterium symbiont of Bathyaustriella thionipta]MCU7953174.1 hypothetical protein [gamma proteobacterium symbiont of Bathyaustriella thionipta]MCU7957908.1 hypothetical protein [gamma proteobacterium symbiont of Bathyaustriella thionipta]MCU7965965.1 hypothetical protein [gamma proteobacterium symbiont of Bathyaustriella thionipta]
MIKSDSEYIKGLPEQYFTIPKDKKVDLNTLGIAIYRIEIMVDRLVALEYEGKSNDTVQDIAFVLEGLVYQAKELAGSIE